MGRIDLYFNSHIIMELLLFLYDNKEKLDNSISSNQTLKMINSFNENLLYVIENASHNIFTKELYIK